jgi:hypothetical protein
LFRVHYICMDKKKKLQESSVETEEISADQKHSKEVPAFVTEVVEEVENDDEEVGESLAEEKEAVPEEILSNDNKKDVSDLEIHNEVLHEELHEEHETEDPHPEDTKRQMVEDIFSPKQTNNLVDIAINKKTATQPAIVWASIIIVVSIVTGGGMILLTKNIGEKNTVAVTPTPTVTQILTPSPMPKEVKREDLKIQVLNGGGKAGAGSKMKTFLTDLGYTVSAVGNTDEYTFEKTEIEVKAGKESVLELVRTDLTKDYSLGTASSTLASDSPFDVRVTVGK